MLYAFLLQKGHVGELTHAFGKLLDDPHQLQGATVIDIGCGPYTAGLALANVAGNGVIFRYFGVDTSQSMCALGAELAEAAKEAGGLNPQTSVDFTSSVEKLDFGPRRAGWSIVILSYLLASKSIDVELLVRQIVDACNRIGFGPVALLYTNAARPEARASFPEFRDRLIDSGFIMRIEKLETLTDGDKPRKIHYALFVRLAAPPIPLATFNP
jgi:SAM-dependent methyltransferase